LFGDYFKLTNIALAMLSSSEFNWVNGMAIARTIALPAILKFQFALSAKQWFQNTNCSQVGDAKLLGFD
jgi:hypothetical protein